MTAPPRSERDLRPEPAPAEDSRSGRLERELLDASRELSRLHRELEAQRELNKRERAEREDLLGVVSHELRTPVTVIGGYGRLLLSEEVGPLNSEQRKFLEESQKSCGRLDAFIEKLLLASEANRGHEVLEVGRGRLAPVLQGIAEMFRPMLGERDLRLSLDVAAEPAEARFDRVRLEQVLTNLIGNAVKFTPPGGSIEIATRGLETPDDEWVRRWVEIRVSDDGPGIAVGDRARVFEPYVQLGDRDGGGLGLGLAICKRLVEAHGGRIALDERLGGGCTFRFTLPIDAPCPQEDA
jgi:signal transduction histidine kinase